MCYTQAIKTYAERRSYSAWQEVFLLPTAHCVSPYSVDESRLAPASLIALTTESGAPQPSRYYYYYYYFYFFRPPAQSL